jgi:energy-coupling factor transporter ATP-binding protein EcfA2
MNESIQAELFERLELLSVELEDDLARVADLGAVARRRDRLQRLRADLVRQLERVHEAAVITLVGATGAGKSTLLNALVGKDIAVEGTDRPTTRQPVIYAPRDADLSQLTEGLPGDPPDVVRYDSDRGGPWTEQVLIDAPDVNSIAAEHRDVVRVLSDRSDVLLVVLHRQSVVEEASVSFVDAFVGRRAMVFVLGRADELTADSRASLLASLRELAGGRFEAPDAPVIALSARAARSDPDTPGWRELTDALRGLVREGVLGGVRRHNALGTAAAIGDLFAEFAEEERRELQALPGELEAGLVALAETTSEEVALRLSLRRADLASLLWSETSKRWDGPGGWALRVGGLSGLGLGAGLLVARRNPLLAAGTAVGAMAAGKLRESAERRRVADLGELFPAQSEFESWYIDALGPARRRAARLAGDPTAFGLPDSAAAAECLWPPVADAWNDLVQRDLPRAAEQSAVGRLRLLFDFPVYALGAYVVVRAVQGYWTGAFLGIDFLVNTLLILLAYLFGVRTVCRRALSLRAKRLLDGVIERSRQSMQSAGGAMEKELAARTTAVVDALERLAYLETRWRMELGAGRKRDAAPNPRSIAEVRQP